jgi:hypothetical protein
MAKEEDDLEAAIRRVVWGLMQVGAKGGAAFATGYTVSKLRRAGKAPTRKEILAGLRESRREIFPAEVRKVVKHASAMLAKLATLDAEKRAREIALLEKMFRDE